MALRGLFLAIGHTSGRAAITLTVMLLVDCPVGSLEPRRLSLAHLLTAVMAAASVVGVNLVWLRIPALPFIPLLAINDLLGTINPPFMTMLISAVNEDHLVATMGVVLTMIGAPLGQMIFLTLGNLVGIAITMSIYASLTDFLALVIFLVGLLCMNARDPTPVMDKCKVGLAGFEPATSCTQSRRATKLRYSPAPIDITVRAQCINIAQGRVPADPAGVSRGREQLCACGYHGDHDSGRDMGGAADGWPLGRNGDHTGKQVPLEQISDSGSPGKPHRQTDRSAQVA